MNFELLAIIKKVQAGELTIADAASQMETLEFASNSEARSAQLIPAENLERDEPLQVEETQPEIGWWKDAWLFPFWVGTGIFVFAAILMGWAYSSGRFFWFYCAWLPLLFGLLALFLGWWSRTSRWLHVRVEGAESKQVSISFPLPLRLASWLLRIFGPIIPQLKRQNLTELPVILDALRQAEGPLTVEVNDKNGERVRVYIL